MAENSNECLAESSETSRHEKVLHPWWWSSVYWLFLIGILIRILAVNRPLVDAQLWRQTQTAEMTRGIAQESGWHAGAVSTWRGDWPARLVLEVPAYNYLVIALFRLAGNLDACGKVMSVLLWGAGFVVLHRIWRRCLTGAQEFWANLLFVLAPLSVFFGQAFMPEMLVQLLAFGFLLALLRYQERPSSARMSLAMAIGLLGLLVKAPEAAHLYVIAAVLLWQKEGLRALRAPVYWAAAIATAAVMVGWSHVIDASNSWATAVVNPQSGVIDASTAPYSAETTSRFVLEECVGSFRSHFDLRGSVPIAFYLVGFVLTPVGLVFALAGAGRLFRALRANFSTVWILSTLGFYFFWAGQVARVQSYYNLPALAPCCLLFGLGADAFASPRSGSRSPWRSLTVVAFLAPFVLVGSLYLFRPDRVVLESARWLRQNTQPQDLILVKANHRNDSVFYAGLAAFPYYGQRRCWIYSQATPSDPALRALMAEERRRSLVTSKYALVTLPPSQTPWFEF